MAATASRKPRVWISVPFVDAANYLLIESEAVPDVLTPLAVGKLVHCRMEFFDVYFMGFSRPHDDKGGIAAREDGENMFDHAPGATDVYLRLERIPVSQEDEPLMTQYLVKGEAERAAVAHLLARQPRPSSPCMAAKGTGVCCFAAGASAGGLRYRGGGKSRAVSPSGLSDGERRASYGGAASAPGGSLGDLTLSSKPS